MAEDVNIRGKAKEINAEKSKARTWTWNVQEIYGFNYISGNIQKTSELKIEEHVLFTEVLKQRDIDFCLVRIF